METAFSNQNGCLQTDSKRSLTPLLLMPWERYVQLTEFQLIKLSAEHINSRIDSRNQQLLGG